MHKGSVNTLVGVDAWAEQIQPRELLCRRVLGVDLGTKCGIAVADVPLGPGKADMIAGIWDLSIGPYDSGPTRHLRMLHFLALTMPDLIVYENVKYTPPGDQIKVLSIGAVLARAMPAAEFLGGLKTTLTTWAERVGIPAHGLDIGEIKKYATGRGNAGKDQMIIAANARYGLGLSEDEQLWKNQGDDNIADAAHCCALGIEYYATGLWSVERSTNVVKKRRKAEKETNGE